MHSKLEYSQYKVISFDIFDTLLFRTVRRPMEVFERVFETNRELFPNYIDVKDWSEMRNKAEQRVRKKKFDKYNNYEVTLEEIYSELPVWINNKRLLQELELIAEKESCYLNKEIYKQINWIKNNTDSKVILVSDMYLNHIQIREILEHNGFDLLLIDHIYVSCDYYTSKRLGKLYEIVLEDLQITPQQLLHIGDNEASDIGIAQKLGINTFYYDMISAAEVKHPLLLLERLRFNDNATEIYALRNYVSSLYEDKNKDDKFWYQLGAMVFGPLFTYAVEWALDIAEENKIKTIYPLMREGKLLGSLLRNAAAERETLVRINELYISRNASYFPSLESINEQQIRYILSTMNMKVKDVFRILNIEEHGESYKLYYEYEISKCRDVLFEDGNLYDHLLEKLLSDKMKLIIQERVVASKAVINRYFNQIGMNDRYMTIDVGWRGSIQGAINRIQGTSNNVHLILMGLIGSLDNVLDNCDLRGFVGTSGKNKDDILNIFIRLFEMISTCDEGTTIGYREVDGEIHPVLQQVEYLYQEQLNKVKMIQNGILRFQVEYMELVKKKPYINRLKARPEQLAKIVGRLTSSPLYEEAHRLGGFYYDQNFGANNLWPVIDNNVLDELKKKDMLQFLSQDNSRQHEWYAGLFVLKDPFYYITQYTLQNSDFNQIKRIAFAQFIMSNIDGKIVIVGAGEAGKSIYRYLELAGKSDLVECFVDNDVTKQGTIVNNKKVYSLDDEFTTDSYVVGSFAYINEIVERIKQKKGNQVKIISYRGKE